MEIPHKITRINREIDFLASHDDADSVVLIKSLEAVITYAQSKIDQIQSGNTADADAVAVAAPLPDSEEIGQQPTLNDAPEIPVEE